MPINACESYHGYDVTDYMPLNSEYRNYYRWVAENDSKDYNEEDVSNWGGRVWWDMGDSYYYGLFGGHMPDLNYNNPAGREEIKPSTPISSHLRAAALISSRTAGWL